MTQQDGTGHGPGLPDSDPGGVPASGPALDGGTEHDGSAGLGSVARDSEPGPPFLSPPGAFLVPADSGPGRPPGNPDHAFQPAEGPAGHGAAEPGRPSPYLEGGAAVPAAYLAPPQPGQPRYGAPLPYRSGSAAPQEYARRGASPSPGQPGQGPARNGRPGWPGGARTGPARRARDPAVPQLWQRLAAATLDWLLVALVATVVTLGPLLHLYRQLEAVSAAYPDLSTPAAQAALNHIASEPASLRAVLYWFLTVFGLALASFWVQHAVWGATVGKRLLRLRVVTATDQAPIGVRAAGIRAVVTVAGPLMFLVLVNPVKLLGGVLWVGDLGMMLIDARGRCLHDMAAGTMVVREQSLAQRREPGSW
jgi:uncharacterized RDD family membrane protein YckC